MNHDASTDKIIDRIQKLLALSRSSNEHEAAVTAGMEGKRLTYAHLIAENGLESGARS